MKLDNISIVMVGTTHPGNIGAAARAMHNMCISNLVLVNPQCSIGEIAYARAAGANSILDRRQTSASLQEAVQDCNLVIASSARVRSLPWSNLTPGSMAQKISDLGDQSRAALVFGCEHSGLTNEELHRCNYVVNIPTNPKFSSLNVASAIQVLCYEVFNAGCNPTTASVANSEEAIASSQELEGYFQHLEQVMTTTRFLDKQNPGLLMQKLRRLYHRFELSKNEINILRGILSSVEKFKS